MARNNESNEGQRTTYTSPDGLLKMYLHRAADGEVTIGFPGYPWHTHGDVLAALASTSQEDAVQRFLYDVLNDTAVIAVSRVDGEIRDVWITDNPAEESRWRQSNETLEFRRWSGSSLDASRSGQ